jgi:pimeloyl-ACP methyl ester carboxylesterase
MEPLEKQLRYACGLVPELAHIDYYDVSTAESNTDFSAGVGPSLACACAMAAALVASEATIILLDRRRTRAIPHTVQFDPYTYRYERTFVPGGMSNYDPAPAIARLADRSSLVPQVLDFLYSKPQAPRVDVNGAKLFYREEGEGDPLVLVGPLGADSSFWARQLDDLTGAFRVVTFDARGSGVSTPCPEGCSIELLADDLIGLLDHAGVSNAHLTGLALGGLVAVEVAARRPDLVRSLVLASSYANADEHLRQVTARWRELARDRGMEELFEACLDSLFSAEYVRGNRAELDKLKTFFHLTIQDPESFCQQSLAGVTYDARPVLGRVQCPTLVLHGGGDRLVHRRHAEELAAAIPDARLVVLDAAPHFLTWESSKLFNQELLTFLS